MKAKIRKLATFVEETRREMERDIAPATRKAAAVAVIENPFAGKYVDDLSELMSIGEELGEREGVGQRHTKEAQWQKQAG